MDDFPVWRSAAVSKLSGDILGYELHITRADDWGDSASRPITAEEWQELVAADSELRFDKQNGEHFAVWLPLADETETGWFSWSDGCISTKSPNKETYRKMLEISAKLSAKVQGDDGEIYRRLEDLSDRSSPQNLSVDRWERFIMIAGPLLFVGAAGITIYRLINWLR